MPRSVAVAVVRDEPPEVFVAEDQNTLNWVLALRLVARTPGSEFSPGQRTLLRNALRNEQWVRPWKSGLRRGPRSTSTRRTSSPLANGRAFLEASDALRGRRPIRVEWKGPHRPPGDDVIPADIRIDHVFLVSCKYLSRVLLNPGPQRLFERLLVGEQRGGVKGQPEVAWNATVRRKVDDTELSIHGHVEIRWSHGRFVGVPESKVYLDTPHSQVPGYHELR
jgi:hypothetical protein